MSLLRNHIVLMFLYAVATAQKLRSISDSMPNALSLQMSLNIRCLMLPPVM